MWPVLRNAIRKVGVPLNRQAHGYGGGCPGNNLPFKLDSPMRLTLWYLIFSVVGFGAPFLVIRHQMLRNVTDDAPKE